MLDLVAEQHTVHAAEWPGFGDEQTEGHLEDMLDFTLHGWDLVDAMGLGETPHVAGHSMGGMIAAEMAAVNPYGLRLARAGLRGRAVARRAPGARHLLDAAVRARPGAVRRPGGGRGDPHRRARLQRRRGADELPRAQRAAAGHGRQDPLPDPQPSPVEAAVPGHQPDAAAVGRARQASCRRCTPSGSASCSCRRRPTSRRSAAPATCSPTSSPSSPPAPSSPSSPERGAS